MGQHPGVLLVIADRLAQADGAWRPYAMRSAPADTAGASG
jgi:hypothetical protein